MRNSESMCPTSWDVFNNRRRRHYNSEFLIPHSELIYYSPNPLSKSSTALSSAACSFSPSAMISTWVPHLMPAAIICITAEAFAVLSAVLRVTVQPANFFISAARIPAGRMCRPCSFFTSTVFVTMMISPLSC